MGDSNPPSEETQTMYLPGPGRGIPADLLFILLIALGAVITVAVPALAGTPLRTVFGAFFVLFVPGYAIVAALFPEDDRRTTDETGDEAYGSGGTVRRSMDSLERLLVSIGMSAAAAGLSGIGLHLTSLRLEPEVVLVPLIAITVLATAVAIRRRHQLPSQRRFRVPYRQWSETVSARLEEPSVELAVNAILILSIVLACSTLAFALLFPQNGEEFTEFYLLTENETEGLRAADYPTEFGSNDTRTIHAAVGNYEKGSRNYTLIVELQKLERNDDTVTVVASERLSMATLQLRHNETEVRPISISPQMTGQDLRLTFLLYVGAPPSDPSVSNAYRETHLWVNVSRSSVA